MDVRDGYITGIFNYCDRWCEACRFTSRCRIFAGGAEQEAAQDPGFRELVELQELDEERERRKVPDWLLEIVEEAEAAVDRGDVEEYEPPAPALAHLRITDRSHGYTHSVLDWLRGRDGSAVDDPSDPVAVVRHFAFFISGKVHRAVTGLASADEHDDGYPADHDGSAKAALLAMERSRDAWELLLQRGVVTSDQAHGWIADLTWLIEALDRVFPGARTFVRPGFDEPDEVARLEACGE